MLRFVLAAMALISVTCGIVYAQSARALVKEGWSPVELRELEGTADYQFRTGPTSDLYSEGDFNGDARADRANLWKNERLGLYGVFVCFSYTGKGSCACQAVSSGRIADLSGIGVSMASQDDSDCRRVKEIAGAACIGIFSFEAGGALYRWDGTKFVELWVSD